MLLLKQNKNIIYSNRDVCLLLNYNGKIVSKVLGFDLLGNDPARPSELC